MSYDLSIKVKVDGTDLFATVAIPEHDNPTYNLGPMFRAATGWDFHQSDVYRVTDVIGNITNGINELHLHPEKYKEYEAPNGWGTIDGAVSALESLRDCIYETAKTIPMQHLWVSW